MIAFIYVNINSGQNIQFHYSVRNDVDIDLHDFSLGVDDLWVHLGSKQEAESIEFVEGILNKSDASTDRFESIDDAVWEAFVNALRSED